MVLGGSQNIGGLRWSFADLDRAEGVPVSDHVQT